MALLEREGHRDELGRRPREAAGGQGRLVFLDGEAGVGKTALVREVCRSARGRTCVLTGACHPLSTGPGA